MRAQPRRAVLSFRERQRRRRVRRAGQFGTERCAPFVSTDEWAYQTRGADVRVGNRSSTSSQALSAASLHQA
jgi:hypothetical protein